MMMLHQLRGVLAMGLLTDFFVATSDEVRTADWNSDPLRGFPSILMKRIDPVKIGTLDAILTDVAYQQLQPEWMNPIWESPTGESWVFQVPESLNRLLVQLDSVQIKMIAEKWCATDELKIDSFSSDDAEWVISNLASLAKKGDKQGRWLYVRISL
jgi:hypothetical protein